MPKNQSPEVDSVPVGKGEFEQLLLPRMANRHGLITGATGTGKTVTLKVLAEGFSRIGVPVFVADVKGDIASLAQPGSMSGKLQERLDTLGITDFEFNGYPITLWDIFGQSGHPIRTTISEMGPLLLSRLLDLNETQSGVLTLAFTIADDHGMLLLDLKDLRSLLTWLGDNRQDFTTTYGNISTASIGAIQRRLLGLERQGGKKLFGEPALELADFKRVDGNGRGIINVLAADKLIQNPVLYSTFLLYLMSELWEQLPELGDPDKPELVFFFDEAHLLFDDAPKALLDKVEQVARLIRSKGVGIYFVTQVPDDIPEDVLNQLGNKVQHALRAYTPREQKTVRAAAQSFRINPKLDTETIITELGVGEALVSFLDDKGRPQMVDRTLIRPPESQFGPLKPAQRKALIEQSPLHGKYQEEVDRESAFEILQQRATEAAAEEAKEAARDKRLEEYQRWKKTLKTRQPATRRTTSTSRRRSTKTATEKALESFTGSAMRTIGTQLGRSLIRGILGSLRGR